MVRNIGDMFQEALVVKYILLIFFYFLFAKSAASTSSTLPNSILLIQKNSRPTSVTLPGPKTIWTPCSRSTTPNTELHL